MEKLYVVILSDEKRNLDIIDEERFANLFNASNVKGLALVMLSSCECGSEREVNGIAKSLVERGVPAVIAMRSSVRDYLAPKFSGSLYEKLIQYNYSLEQAFIDSRHKAFLDWSENVQHFAAPMLYLGRKIERERNHIRNQTPTWSSSG
jgi:CHAT domain-containing protein